MKYFTATAFSRCPYHEASMHVPAIPVPSMYAPSMHVPAVRVPSMYAPSMHVPAIPV